MESYPQQFAGTLKRLTEEVRVWTAAQVEGNGEEADEAFGAMDQIKIELEGQGVLDEHACQQLHDMAASAAAVTLCRQAGLEGLEEREGEFAAACEPQPEEVSDTLWRKTQALCLAAAGAACADSQGHAATAAKQHRLYDKLARRCAGLGTVRSAGVDDLDEYASRAADVIPGTVIMFSGCQDCQTSADVYNTASFGLPADAGPGGAGGACTSSMIKALSEGDDYTWVSLLGQMRGILQGSYTQIPMLSSSRSMDLNSSFSVVNPEPSGRFRALLVGINYVGSSCELRGCHNDVDTMQRYLMTQGYEDGDMRVMLDDGDHEEPTLAKMIEGFQWLVDGAASGDSLFFHYSGHGAQQRDDDGDEADGKDECLCPVDFQAAGLLIDDTCFKYLVAPLQRGVSLTCVMDCCHSGSILDLPYEFKADDGGMEAAGSGTAAMAPNPDFDFGKLAQVIKEHPGVAAGAAFIGGCAYFAASPEQKKVIRRSVVDVLSAEDKGAALMGAAKNVLGSFFR